MVQTLVHTCIYINKHRHGFVAVTADSIHDPYEWAGDTWDWLYGIESRLFSSFSTLRNLFSFSFHSFNVFPSYTTRAFYTARLKKTPEWYIKHICFIFFFLYIFAALAKFVLYIWLCDSICWIFWTERRQLIRFFFFVYLGDSVSELRCPV